MNGPKVAKFLVG